MSSAIRFIWLELTPHLSTKLRCLSLVFHKPTTQKYQTYYSGMMNSYITWYEVSPNSHFCFLFFWPHLWPVEVPGLDSTPSRVVTCAIGAATRDPQPMTPWERPVLFCFLNLIWLPTLKTQKTSHENADNQLLTETGIQSNSGLALLHSSHGRAEQWQRL